MRTRVAVALIVLSACSRDSSIGRTRALPAPHPPLPPFEAGVAGLVETIYEGGYRNGWGDWGWAKRDVAGPGPAKVDFSDWGGWILAKQGFAPGPVGRLVFRVKPAAGEALDYLQIKIAGSEGEGPEVKVTPDEIARMPPPQDDWSEIQVPTAELDPDGLPFDRVIIHASRRASGGWTLLDHVGFTAGDGSAPSRRASAAGFPPDASRLIAASIACGARATHISPRIYGTASTDGEYQWHLGATIRRWGGNTSSRYNWKISAHNLANDWFFENKGIPSYTHFLEDNAAHGVESAVTVPMLGWVAKDTTSLGFPVDVVGPQEKTDPYLPRAGNGKSKDGTLIPGGPEARTSVAAPPEFMKAWVQAIRAADADAGQRSVVEYILDNEPALWHETHRDVRHEPIGYDELVERTIAYGTAIRQADPDALIAGPAEWGWNGYLYSAKDSEGHWAKADRKAHGDVPLIVYYLRKLREYEQKTGVRVLDAVDLHFYPQAPGVFGDQGTDEKTNALRIRQTRGLWDPAYTDESWIKDKIRLLPRMREWIDANYPGRQISIGEWNFGAENNMSGGLATAEALGRFAQFGVDSAFFWKVPAEGSPSMEAFVAYRNFDGKGGRFLDWYLPSQTADDTLVSMFASRDAEGKHVVAVLLNLSPSVPIDATIDASSCGAIASRQTFTLYRGARAIEPGASSSDAASKFDQFLPPYSITVLDVHLASALPGTAAK
ncbi:MAG TPA: glycoside hydrolase family 44 protein [Polyangiaceae bacterium]